MRKLCDFRAWIVGTSALLWAISVSWAPIQSAAAVSAPVLKWQRGGCTSWCQTGWYASPAVADLDADGHQEVIWGSYDLVALDGKTGALKWRAPHSSRVYPGVIVADLTGDGTLEIVVGRNSDNLMVYNSAGTLLWTRHPFGSGEVRTVAVADLDGDGVLEIIAGHAAGVSTNQVKVYSPAGNVRSGWPAKRAGEPGYGAGLFNKNIAIDDLDGDDDMELIVSTDSHYIMAFDDHGNQLTVHSMYTGRNYWSQVGVHVDHYVDIRGYAICGTEHRPNFINGAPAIADVDGDGTREIIVVGNVHNCANYPYTSLYHIPFIFRLNRTRWSGSGFDWTVVPSPPQGAGPKSEDYNVIQSAMTNVVPADLDGDGRLEILFPSYDGRLHAYWLDKTQHGAWPYTVPASGSGGDTFRFASEPAVADLDGDGSAEVVFCSWPKNDSYRWGHLHVLDALGNELHRVSLPAPSSGSWNGGLAAPTLADIDGDGELEAVLGTASTGVVAYDLPGTSGARILWGTGRGSQHRRGVATPRTGAVPDFDGDGIPDILWRNPSTGKNAIWYMQNKGTAVKSSAWAPSAAIDWIVGGIAFFDGDMASDILWRNPSTGKNAIWYMQNNGTAIKSSAWAPTVTAGWDVEGVADFDGDGAPDVLWRNPGTGKNAIWYMQNNGTAVKSSAWAPSVAVDWQAGQISDFDGDGAPDILWRNPSTGKNAIWYMQNNGQSIRSSAWAPTAASSWEIGG